MSKSYKVSKKTMNMGPKKGKTVYSVRPYSYGTLTTKDIANQIAMESTATPADVMAVLDRYTYYVKESNHLYFHTPSEPPLCKGDSRDVKNKK